MCGLTPAVHAELQWGRQAGAAAVGSGAAAPATPRRDDAVRLAAHAAPARYAAPSSSPSAAFDPFDTPEPVREEATGAAFGARRLNDFAQTDPFEMDDPFGESPANDADEQQSDEATDTAGESIETPIADEADEANEPEQAPEEQAPAEEADMSDAVDPFDAPRPEPPAPAEALESPAQPMAKEIVGGAADDSFEAELPPIDESMQEEVAGSDEVERELPGFDADAAPSNLDDQQDDWRTPSEEAPSLTPEQEAARQRKIAAEREAALKDCEELQTKARNMKLSDISLNIKLDGEIGEDFPFECPVGHQAFAGRSWAQVTYRWKASGLCHKPLYFEQVQLERYGHSWGPYLDPVVSGAHFFATLPILPYKMGLQTPNECVYTLGYYRPGSCAPYMIDPVPFTWRAALFQGAAVTGVNFIIP